MDLADHWQKKRKRQPIEPKGEKADYRDFPTKKKWKEPPPCGDYEDSEKPELQQPVWLQGAVERIVFRFATTTAKGELITSKTIAQQIWDTYLPHIEKARQEVAREIFAKVVCPMCYRLNPQHTPLGDYKGCTNCQEKEEWCGKPSGTGGE